MIPVTFAALALLTLVPAWREAGWPANHEAAAFAQRTYVYARHYAAFDFLPIWSSIDAYGFGSPMPVVYHKLFYMVSAPLLLATGSMKVAIVAALGIFLTAGALGIRALVRAAGGSELAAFAAGCALLTANYTISNWFVRGAMAELAGSMLAIWVIYYFVQSLSSGRLVLGVGIALGLVWLAHSVLAFYVFLVLGATYLLLAAVRLAPWSLLHPRTAWPAVACFACLPIPFLVPMAVLAPGYDFARIIQPPWRPEYQFRPALSYLWDTYWTPLGAKSFGLTMQLDYPIVALLVASAFALFAARRFAPLVAVLPLALAAILCLALQWPLTAPFYEWTPGAAFIQFPWRLLALLTPALIAAAFVLGDVAWTGEARPFLLGATLAWMLAACIAFAPMPVERIAIDTPDTTRVSFSFPNLREYEPVAAPHLRGLIPLMRARWEQAGCSYEPLDGTAEVTVKHFETYCARAEQLPLPLYASPLHMVHVPGHFRSHRCLPMPEFPAICGAVVPGGSSVISVSLPTVRSLPRWFWERQP